MIKYIDMKNSFFTSLGKKALSTLGVLTVLLFSVMNLYGQDPCANDINDPVFDNCEDREIVLPSGACTTQLIPSLAASDNCTSSEDRFTTNLNDDVVTDGLGCLMGDISFYQIYEPGSGWNTPFTPQSVLLGVYNAENNPSVTVNFYLTHGFSDPDSWTLIGEGTAFLGTASNTFVTIPVNVATILPTQEFAIEVIAPTAAVYGNIVGLNDGGHTSPTFFKSSACGVNALTDVVTELGSNYGMALSIIGESDGVFITPAPGNPYAVDYNFPAGVYNLSYIATDNAGNSSSCSFILTVSEEDDIVTSLACNDLVQISLDTLCETTVDPDEILEGDHYGCYGNYEVVIYNKLNQPIGNVINKTYIGQTLKVSVFNQAGNSCWGLIKVEDKKPAILDCSPIYTTCAGDLEPGSPLPDLITVQADLSGAVIPSNSKYARDYYVNVYGLGDAIINDVNVMVDINHQNVNNLQVLVTSPWGTTVKLFGGIAENCAFDNIRVTMDDEASSNYNDLENTCLASNPAVAGYFQPFQALGIFDGHNAEGQWKFTVIDSTATDGGEVNELSLVFDQEGGFISFPTQNPVTFIEQGPGYYTVFGIDPCGPTTMGYVDDIRESDCSSIYSKVIARTWSATDASGNSSPACTQFIYVYRNGLASLHFPPNYDGHDQPTLSCLQFGDVVPTPEYTGEPYGDFCENIQVFPYEDVRIDICPKSYKILRKWKLLEWCNSQVVEHTQIIKVVDEQGPVMTCPQNITISTDPLFCSRDYTPEKPLVTSECSSKLTYDLYYYIPDATGVLPVDAIFVKDNVVNNGTTIKELPVGKNYLLWRVWDECGNYTECIFSVTVRDEVPPVAVCDQFTKVSIGSNGFGEVAAFTFDDISNDNCEIVRYQARKMTNKCLGGTSTQFRDTILFCCDEVGTSIMVEFRVTDRSGNSNTCMVEVKVEDKLPPYITKCPANITIECQTDYKNTTITGEPVAIDNCKVNSVSYADSGSPNNCGEGTIRRTWTVRDAQGLTGSCVQTIVLEDSDPFDKNDIIWPLDYDATTCHANLNPENLPLQYAYPKVTDDACSLTSITYKDQHFTFVDGACEKVLRTWTVIDWCTYVENTNIGIYTDLQIIKLGNTIDPVFNSCRDTTVNIFDDCRGPVTLAAGATDDCTPIEQLKYTYRIDLKDDGVTDAGLSGTTRTFTHTLPIGKHRVYWTVEDQCGNRTSCNFLLTVRDGKKPTPYCLSSVTTVVMPSSGMISIWSTDFDHGSYDNCTPQEKLKFSFTSNIKDTSKVFFCSDIPDGIEMEVPVEIWVTDEAGNQDYCTVTLVLQDNTGNVCPDKVGSRVVLGGRIKTEQNKSLNGAMVTLWEGNVKLKEFMTTTAGNFVLDNVLIGKNYQLSVTKNDDVLNGLSTLDLVLIQRHILGAAKLDSPYKVIASDVNNDGKVLASDLVSLRKLILGLALQMPSGQKSWRFVNSAQTFSNANNPFPFEEKINLDNLASNMYNQDFYAIKIGDVNSSIVLNIQDEIAEPRSNEVLNLEYEVVNTDGGNRVDFFATKDQELFGFQMSVEGLGEVSKAVGSRLSVANENYANGERGFAMSWNTDNAQSIKAGELLFSLYTKGETSSLKLAGLLKDEAYLSTEEVSDIELTARSNQASNPAFEVYQNEPNPFSHQTKIGFKLPEAADATLKIYDQSGKILHMQKNSFAKGLNHFTVQNADLGTSGIMYYEVSSQNFKATRKMIGLK